MTKLSAVILIVITGLLNFHVPHFLIENNNLSGASSGIELVYLANLVAALIAATGIYYNYRWGWMLGIFVAGFSALLWLLQETIGLPGLPQMWLEPSRIVSLVIEALFLIFAYRYFMRQDLNGLN